MIRPGYSSGATPASALPPPTVGVKPAPPPQPREVDEVRQVALANAVEHHARFDADASLVLATARTFEAYLTGEEPS
jgi:hypothetical protein